MEKQTDHQAAQAMRKPYRPPRLERVYLMPEQSVLDICLGASKYGPNATHCQPVGYCSSPGS